MLLHCFQYKFCFAYLFERWIRHTYQGDLLFGSRGYLTSHGYDIVSPFLLQPSTALLLTLTSLFVVAGCPSYCGSKGGKYCSKYAKYCAHCPGCNGYNGYGYNGYHNGYYGNGYNNGYYNNGYYRGHCTSMATPSHNQSLATVFVVACRDGHNAYIMAILTETTSPCTSACPHCFMSD